MNETIARIKKQFFTFRNGILADTLRKQGCYEIVFGLQVPQIAEIARQHIPSMELADRLWSDRKVRESRLLATYLFPPEEVSEEKAVSLAEDVATVEEADMLAFRLLKRLPFRDRLLETIKENPGVSPYMIKTLSNHLA
ncbi:MAG: DNA alkylation repair protein [Muribaculaceae bacterium]|nr:DNA alkylation repair protein [Muribaculaceae bacterium]